MPFYNFKCEFPCSKKDFHLFKHGCQWFCSSVPSSTYSSVGRANRSKTLLRLRSRDTSLLSIVSSSLIFFCCNSTSFFVNFSSLRLILLRMVIMSSICAGDLDCTGSDGLWKFTGTVLHDGLTGTWLSSL